MLYSSSNNATAVLPEIALLFLAAFIQVAGLFSQTNDAAKYEVASAVINNCLSIVECDYFYVEKPIEPKRLHTDSTLSIIYFDLETYEESTMSTRQYDSLYFQKNHAEYRKELGLWNYARGIQKKVILLVSGHDTQRTRELIGPGLLEKSPPGFGDLTEQLSRSAPKTWKASKLKTAPGFMCVNFSGKNEVKYKYAAVAHVSLSDVMFDREKKKATVLFGFHYKIGEHKSDRGHSGFGVFAYLNKRESGWEVVKYLGIWEE